MKKRVFVLSNIALLVLAGCGSGTSENTETKVTEKNQTDVTETAKRTEVPAPVKNYNRSKGGKFTSDINLSLLVANLNSTIRDLPVTANFRANDDGLLNLSDNNKALELTADLTKANAYTDEEGNSVSSTDAAINNIKGFKNLVTIPEQLSSISSLLPVSLSSVFPGQYKALGYEFSKMVSSLDDAQDKSAALTALGQETVSLYLNDVYTSAAETHNGKNVRAYHRMDSSYEIDTSGLDSILEMVTILQELDISEIQKLDFVSLIDNIENGTIITDETNETIRNVYQTIKKVGDIFVGGIGLDKMGKTNEDGTVDAGFRLYLNEYGLGQLKKTMIEEISSIESVPSIVATLLDSLEFTDFSVAIDLYKGLDEYTHFGGFAFDLAFKLGTAESNITISLEMDHDSGSELASDYFSALDQKNNSFKTTSDAFDIYYDAVGRAVSYYDGDYVNSGMDIRQENGEVLRTALNQYDSLTDDVKFMLTDAFKKEDIMTKYDEGRKALMDAIAAYKTAYDKESSHSISTIASKFKTVSEYDHWKEALEEQDEETYQNARKVEVDEITSVENRITSYLDELNTITDKSTDAETERVLKTDLNGVRDTIKNYKPTSFFGIVSPAKYSDSILFGDDLILRKDAFLADYEGSRLYDVEIGAIDCFVGQLSFLVKDTSKTSKEIVDAFSDYSKKYVSNLTSSSSMIDSSLASDYLHAHALELTKDDYMNAVTPYVTETIDKTLDEYQKLKADPSTVNKAAWAVVAAAQNKVLKNICNREIAVYGQMLNEESFNFLTKLIKMGNSL